MNATCAAEKPRVGEHHDLALFRQMLLIRRFEEKCAEMYAAGKIQGILHLSIGQEAVAVGAMRALAPADNVVATYREHGHALARGMAPGAAMAEMYGKANGCSRGRGGSRHLFDANLRFFGGYAIAVGLALADKLKNRPAVTACFFEDGAVSEGEFHESMNLATLWELPVLFLCENNLYALGTHLARHQSQTDIARKAEAHGMPGEAVDGMDVRAVAAAVRRAADAVRGGGGPRLLELRTYRFRAHSVYDAELYRGKEEVERWKERDPIATFAAKLRGEDVLTGAEEGRAEREVAAEVAGAVAFAESGPWEPVADLLKDVHTPAVTR